MYKKVFVGSLVAGCSLLASTNVMAEDEKAVKFFGDFRFGVYGGKTKNRDGSVTRPTTDLRARLRPGIKVGFSDKWNAVVRAAGRYSDEQDSTHFSFRNYNTIMGNGYATFDKFQLNYKVGDKTKITFGRMQNKLEMQGVAKKSLSRADSDNIDIGFTDGIRVVHGKKGQWQMVGVLQHNPIEGSTMPTRGQLDFTDDDTRYSAWFAMEKKEKSGRFVQRAIDITYYPSALLHNAATNDREDYVAIVAKSVLRFPLKNGSQFWLGGSIGFAPETPTKARAGIQGSGDTSGYAYQVSFNLVNFKPNHSLGLVHGKAQAGWLVSPQFPQNESLIELRHKWQLTKKFRMETRVRNRQEIVRRIGATDRRSRYDYYIRFTYKL